MTEVKVFGESNLRPRLTSGVYYFVELREAVGVWSRYNFGEQGAYRPLIGMVEEISELYMARALRDEAGERDAVGDIIIYMADYFYRRNWDLGWVWENRFLTELTDTTLVSLIGRLCHNHLKSEQNIRGGSNEQDMKMRGTCAQVLGHLDTSCSAKGLDVVSVIQDVWSIVGKRDWKKNPNDAHTVATQGASPTPDEKTTSYHPGAEGNPSYEVRDE